MQTIPLSVPHMVLSSQQTLTGDWTLHTLTPFGDMDILFSTQSERSGRVLFDVAVKGDTASWMLEGVFPPSFRTTIIELIGRIVVRHSGAPENGAYRFNIRLTGKTGDVKVSGHLTACVCASADG